VETGAAAVHPEVQADHRIEVFKQRFLNDQF
jgi:hypothetical protein